MASLSILVIGLGYFGESIAREFAELGHEILGVDNDPEAVQRNITYLTDTVEMDATNIDALRTLNIPSYDISVVGRGSDLEESVLITLNLKELGARHIVCKAQNQAQKLILERIGAKQIVEPEKDMGKRIAHILSASINMIDYMDVQDDFSIEELEVPRGWAGKSLSELQLPNRYGIQLLLVKSGDKFTISPTTNFVLQANDIIVVFGHKIKMAQFKR